MLKKLIANYTNFGVVFLVSVRLWKVVKAEVKKIACLVTTLKLYTWMCM